jgi:ATP-dependent helicase YprA (DUF1998 family)
MPKKDLRQIKRDRQRINKQDISEMAKKANIKADLEGVKNEDIQSMQDTISQYENKSENELMGDLEQAIRNGRSDGTFSDEMLEAFVKNVAPMMDSAQRKKLDGIAKMIKNKH